MLYPLSLPCQVLDEFLYSGSFYNIWTPDSHPGHTSLSSIPEAPLPLEQGTLVNSTLRDTVQVKALLSKEAMEGAYKTKQSSLFKDPLSKLNHGMLRT